MRIHFRMQGLYTSIWAGGNQYLPIPNILIRMYEATVDIYINKMVRVSKRKRHQRRQYQNLANFWAMTHMLNTAHIESILTIDKSVGYSDIAEL